jgi:thioredoxin reductase (NADPH)
MGKTDFSKKILIIRKGISMESIEYDVMILGTGPAGISAAIYGQRLGMSTIVFGDIPGGSTYMIERLLNYPGFPGGIPGAEFGVNAFKQAQDEGVLFTYLRLKEVKQSESGFEGIDVNDQTHRAQSVIAATGRTPKRLVVPKAQIRGIHFCSICDGPLFRGKEATLAVVGSDNSAAQHAVALSKIGAKVLLIYRSRVPKMDAAHRKMIEDRPNITVMTQTEVVGFTGLDLLEDVLVSTEGGPQRAVACDGVFLSIGWKANTDLIKIPVEKTLDGYIKTDSKLMSSHPGLFAAGDVRDTDMYQVLTACADGARAAHHAFQYLEHMAS